MIIYPRSLIHILVTLVLVLTPYIMLGKAKDTYYFWNIGLKDHLSQLSVLKIHQDYKGYMWLGTRNGLNRYDGNEMEVYKHDDHDEQHSLADNHITSMAETATHILWIGSMRGLTRFDLVTGQACAFVGTHTTPLVGGARALLVDSSGRLWVGTTSGLYVLASAYTSNKLTNKSFRQLPLIPLLKNKSVTALAESSDGQIWVGTEVNGVYRYNPRNRRLSHYTRSSGECRLPDDDIAEIYEDKQRMIWIATKNGGLCRYNPRTNGMQTFNTYNTVLTTNNIRTVVQMGNKLFLGTFDGLFVIDISTQQLSRVKHYGKGKGQLSHFSVYSLCADKSNGLWIGTYSGGANYFSVYNNRFTLHEPADQIGDEQGIYGQMISFGKDRLFVSTEGSGLLEYNVSADSYKCYPYHGPRGTRGRNIIKSVGSDGNGRLWCGTAEGEVFVFDPTTHRFREKVTLHQTTSVYGILHDPKGGMWLATSKGDMGLVYVAADGKIKRRFSIKGLSKSYGFPSMRCMLTLGHGVLLLGTRNNGLIRFDTQRGVITTYNKNSKEREHLPANYVTTLTRDHMGNVWVGTFGGGICRYIDGKGLTTTVDKAHGLASNEVYMIVADKHNRLWISNGNSITCYDQVKRKMHNYAVDMVGVQEFSPNSGAMLPGGDIGFSASNGFVTFDPNRLTLNTYAPPIVLNSLAVNNKLVIPGNGRLIETVLDDVKTLRLQHDQNNITISYCALNYAYPQQNRYAYRLVGHDKDWNYVGNRHEAYYTNLSPGKYIFELKAANNDGLWSSSIRTLPIVMSPPIWATWYSYLLYACLVVGILFLILYYINKKRALEQALVYEQRVQQQQNEFHQAKMTMYTSFSHELRTPLQLILSPLEHLMNRHTPDLEMKNKLELIYNNAQRLLLLVNQLMDLRKSGSGKMQVKVGQHDLYAYVDEIYGAFKSIAADKDIDLTYNHEKEHRMAWFDKVLFEKILFNLLSNALKSTPNHGRITLILDPADQKVLEDVPSQLTVNLPKDTDLMLLRVIDNGQGIPEEELVKIFEPFYQASNSPSTAGMGSGIGLSLTQAIVHLHHGVIWACNNETGGATFSVVFASDKRCYRPEDLYNDKELVTQDVIPATTGMKVKIGRTYSVLLVEDNAEVRQYVRESLMPWFEVTEATNGKEALQLAMTQQPDIIISDIMMPVMDGLELCRLVKEDMQTSHIPVVLMTARSMAEHIIEGFETGADDYIVKPFSIDILIHRVKNILETREKLKDVYGKHFSPEALGLDLKNSKDIFVQNFFQIIEQNISNPDLNIDFICKEIGVSRSNLYKKLKTVSQLSPIELIKNKRLEVAAQLLTETDHSIFDIAIQTGFNSQAYFSKCFRTVYNCSPSEYIERNRHQ